MPRIAAQFEILARCDMDVLFVILRAQSSGRLVAPIEESRTPIGLHHDLQQSPKERTRESPTTASGMILQPRESRWSFDQRREGGADVIYVSLAAE